MFKKDRLWKFVYEDNSYLPRKKNLLVVAKSLMLATKEFYRLAKGDVTNILEVTEVNYDKEGTVNSGEKG